jgi:hypothetical protein
MRTCNSSISDANAVQAFVVLDRIIIISWNQQLHLRRGGGHSCCNHTDTDFTGYLVSSAGPQMGLDAYSIPRQRRRRRCYADVPRVAIYCATQNAPEPEQRLKQYQSALMVSTGPGSCCCGFQMGM